MVSIAIYLCGSQNHLFYQGLLTSYNKMHDIWAGMETRKKSEGPLFS